MNYKNIEQKIQELFNQNGINVKTYIPPIDAKVIAENTGLQVVFAKFPENNNYNIKVRGFIDNGIIYVNSQDRSKIQNFTIAHELGHWILHQDKMQNGRFNVLYNQPMGNWANKDDLEKEADQFAAKLLVPRESLKRFSRINSDTSELADTFMVSEMVITHRKNDERI